MALKKLRKEQYEVDDTAYGAGWNGNTDAPTKNAVYDKIETLGGGGVDTSGTPVANDFARFTDSDTIEGRSYAEVRADLSLEIGTDVQAYDATILKEADVDDTPVNGATTDPVSSNWAYDHENDTSAHGVTGDVVGTTDTQTLSSKRITPRSNTITSSSTPTPAGDTTDIFTITALAVNATFAAPSGTPTNGQRLTIRIEDNGTTRTLAWNSVYRAVGVTLPLATTANKTIYIGCIYNSTDSKWDVIAVAEEA